jgi:hypothetical protein
LTEIGERETYNYILPNNIIISLVLAGKIVYVELEKMSSVSTMNRDRNNLEGIARQLGLNILYSEKEFNKLCNRLSKSVDRPFYGTKNEYIKLKKLLKKYIKAESMGKEKRPSTLT